MPGSDPLVARLESIMRGAGELAVSTSRGAYKRWTKGHDNSPVSDADIAVNDFLRERLSALVPEAGWLSEETEDHPPGRTQPSVWIVDPIDGTRAFLIGRADWTISVALVESGRPRLAALYAPVTDEMFLAASSRGATLNGAPARVSAGDSLTNASLAGPKRYLDRLTGLLPGIEARSKIHSLALRLSRVAEGTLDAAFASTGSHDWDLAAADLLVHEAGGLLTDFSGRPLQFNRPHVVHGALIAAGPARHAALLELVRTRHSEFA
ncbi:MAG TPA: 3'(2'),5'-bisphosphate nucleotidase CysQ [Pseudolabrys sp.]|nr:3'(2'),5'-bisphosphate nucleotidase CysQ [Pseudolabrys sp.]